MLLVALTCVTVPLATRAGEAAERARLRVKPVLCIAERATGNCAALFHLRWDSARAADYCVATDLQTAPLRCWSRVRFGEHVDERTVNESFSYWLSEGSAGPRLAAVTVEVLRIDSDDRRRDRRSRHVWDVL